MKAHTLTNDQPGFGILLWDNAKTTGYYGAIPVATVAGIAGTPLGLLAGAPEGGFALGFAAGAIVGAPVSAFLFSLPFAIAAQQTREFQSNEDIQNVLKKLTVKDIELQKAIINKVIKEDSRGIVRSFSSANLMSTLKDKKLGHSQKWEALRNYMKERSGNTYTHNGKKLFNLVLKVG